MEELKVKIGDKLLCTTRHYCGTRKKIVTVAKVTSTGRIRITGDEMQFDKYGQQMGSHGRFEPRSSLSVLTQEDYKELQEKRTIAKAISAMERASKNLFYEQAVKILEVLEVDS